MEVKRGPFQGVLNIIQFNWHFYVVAGIVLAALLVFQNMLPIQIRPFVVGLAMLTIFTIAVSLATSSYVYDFSNLYQLLWLPDLNGKKVLNINAGFDETSPIIQRKFPIVALTAGDFYDATKHTEVSIKRARAAYPPIIGTIPVTTDKLPFQDGAFDFSLAILSAHEIRNDAERAQFFKELNRVTKSDGQIFVTEHLRDIPNFLAYTVGFFHFHSKSTWLETFHQAGLKIEKEIKITPFITTFIVSKHGNTL